LSIGAVLARHLGKTRSSKGVTAPMTTTPRKLFVNLRVADLKRSMDFFARLGFTFDPQFTDDNAACMIVSEEAYFMLLTEPMFRRFTRREPADTTKVTEALYALSCDSREGVDQMVKTAVAAGGAHALEPQDHGFMYQSSFYDPDGHHFEVLWMDESAMAAQ
jgi:predicted lactoylglutathione lyase